MFRPLSQLALIGLLACTLPCIAPMTPALRAATSSPNAEAETDRLTRTIRRLAERSAAADNQPDGPDHPDAPGRPDAPDRPEPGTSSTADADNHARRADRALGSGSRGPDTEGEAAAVAPNELKRLGSVNEGDGSDEAGGDGSNLSYDGGGAWVLQTLTALGIVIGLLFLLRWVWTRLSGQSTVASTPVVEVLSRTAVAPRNHVLLLRVGHRILVVGDSASGMRTLASVEDEQEVADLLAAINASKSDSISHNFQQLLGRFGSTHDQAAGTDPSASAGATASSAWAGVDDGRDDAEYLFDSTRNNLSGLASRIRALSRKGGGS